MPNPLATFFLSITDTSIYRRIATTHLTRSVVYFIGSYLIISLAMSLHFSFVTFPQLRTDFSAISQDIVSQLPPDTIITISANDLNITPNPTTISAQIAQLDIPYILRIDPSVNPENIVSLQSLVVLGPKSFSFQTPLGWTGTPYSIFPYDTVTQDRIITQPEIVETLTTINQQLDQIQFIIPVITFVGFTISLIGLRTLNVFLYAIIAQAIGMFIGRQYPYRYFLNISFHTIVVGEVITIAIGLLYQFPIDLYFITMIGLNLIATLALPKTIIIKAKHPKSE